MYLLGKKSAVAVNHINCLDRSSRKLCQAFFKIRLESGGDGHNVHGGVVAFGNEMFDVFYGFVYVFDVTGNAHKVNNSVLFVGDAVKLDAADIDHGGHLCAVLDSGRHLF